MPLHCGSGPARESGLTTDQSLADAHGPTVGASLLAMAVCQATSMLNVSPSSRASLAPTEDQLCGVGFGMATLSSIRFTASSASMTIC
jgi:hypothetical protein